MRALIWILVHWPSTTALAEAERRVSAELDLRAVCATAGRPSPHQSIASFLWRLAVGSGVCFLAGAALRLLYLYASACRWIVHL